ncbi:MAG: hypothetical protein K2Q13_10400 [Nitrosomonas sp.]|uniref:hypothetical protein n=1 Tax=Nitrosomonas sp. TaxID=42353 RepID=UPI0025EFF42B|nr:hypothetical protein [Nitrosomonas sp.]MBY0475452.1 hypothetical protein [Nitrosomonas sp.]
MSEDQFYLQDSRGNVGNDMLFWAKDGKGYTSDFNKAHVFTRDQAFKQNKCRDTDIPWPRRYIDSISRPAVDFQYANIDVAYTNAGIDASGKDVNHG